MSDYDMSIHHNPDAAAWAKFFMETIEDNPNINIDEALMVGWFANAMMAMYDYTLSTMHKGDLNASIN